MAAVMFLLMSMFTTFMVVGAIFYVMPLLFGPVETATSNFYLTPDWDESRGKTVNILQHLPVIFLGALIVVVLLKTITVAVAHGAK